MTFLIKNKKQIKSFEITPEKTYLNRRNLIKSVGILSASTSLTSLLADNHEINKASLAFTKNSEFSTRETVNSFEPKPWTVLVTGEAEKTGTLAYEDIVASHQLEERIYRLRCVEAWSMVIPWVGISLMDFIKKFQPNSKAKYVAFESVFRPSQMPGQKRRILDWPYIEGLTIEEATHPLAFLAVGLYGRELANQNGAPIRLVIPWKYGFKSIKSIVKISFKEKRPKTTWNLAAPNEYGFYANVNPTVDHPRWSQARERRIGSGLFTAKQPTLMFNGYAEEVADLYRTVDLRKNF